VRVTQHDLVQHGRAECDVVYTARPERGQWLRELCGGRSLWPRTERRGLGIMEAPRLVVVVQPNQRDLYKLLRQRLEEIALVIADRRQRERRSGRSGEGPERRHGDRRRRRPRAWFYPAETLDVHATEGHASAIPSGAQILTKDCPTCAMVVRVEMPRFPRPPARLETDVIHMQQANRGVVHYVEIQAFTASGRPLLVHRVRSGAR